MCRIVINMTVLTDMSTACRAIGIPCRSVTNYGSAADTNTSMSVEIYNVVEGLGPDEGSTSENIWDFHCWNDVWMARYDLPQGYGGWQAIDSIPGNVDVFGKIDQF